MPVHGLHHDRANAPQRVQRRFANFGKKRCVGAVQTKLTSAAWKDKPVRWMLTTQDHMVSPTTQRFMATRAKARLTEINSSHAVMLSHPREVVAFIEAAAADAK